MKLKLLDVIVLVLMIYNPKNASQMLKAMKNKNVTREDKIKERLMYEKAQAQVVN